MNILTNQTDVTKYDKICMFLLANFSQFFLINFLLMNVVQLNVLHVSPARILLHIGLNMNAH